MAADVFIYLSVLLLYIFIEIYEYIFHIFSIHFLLKISSGSYEVRVQPQHIQYFQFYTFSK